MTWKKKRFGFSENKKETQNRLLFFLTSRVMNITGFLNNLKSSYGDVKSGYIWGGIQEFLSFCYTSPNTL